MPITKEDLIKIVGEYATACATDRGTAVTRLDFLEALDTYTAQVERDAYARGVEDSGSGRA